MEFTFRRVSSHSSALYTARWNWNILLGYMSLASSNSRLFQHVAMVSLFGRMPLRSQADSKRMITMASLAADQETVIKSESEVEVKVEEEKKLVVLPTNESSENLLKELPHGNLFSNLFVLLILN